MICTPTGVEPIRSVDTVKLGSPAAARHRSGRCAFHPPEAGVTFQVEPVGERQFTGNRQQQHLMFGKEQPPLPQRESLSRRR